MKKHDSKGIVFILPYLLIFGIFQLYPIVNTLYLSFTSYDGGYTDPKFIGVENYYKTITPAQDIKFKNDALEEKLNKNAVTKYKLKDRDVKAVLNEYGITDKEIKENGTLFAKIKAEKAKIEQVEYLKEKVKSENKRVSDTRDSIALTIRTTKDSIKGNSYSLERKRVRNFKLKKLDNRAEIDAKFDIEKSDKEFMQKVRAQRAFFLKHESLSKAVSDKDKFPVELAELNAQLTEINKLYDPNFVRTYKVDVFTPEEVGKNFTIDAQLAFLAAIEGAKEKQKETKKTRFSTLSTSRQIAKNQKRSFQAEIEQVKKSYDKKIISKYNLEETDLIDVQVEYAVFDKTFIAILEEQKLILNEVANNQQNFNAKNDKAESTVVYLKSQLSDLEENLLTIRAGIYEKYKEEYTLEKSRLDADKAKINSEIRKKTAKQGSLRGEVELLERNVRKIEKKIVRLSVYEVVNGIVKASPRKGKEAQLAELEKEQKGALAAFRDKESVYHGLLRQIDKQNEVRAKIDWNLAILKQKKDAYKKAKISRSVFKKSSGVGDIVAMYCAGAAGEEETELITEQFNIWQEIKKNEGKHRGVFVDPYFWQAFVNTVRIWVPNIIIQLGLAFLVSVWFTDVRLRLKGVSIFRAVFYFPNLVMYASIALLFNVLFDFQNGAINQILFSDNNSQYINWMLEGGRAQMIVSCIQGWMWFGHSTIFIMAGLNGIPDTYYEAAVVDGANAWQTFWKITIPLIRPVLTFIAITSLIGGMQIFDLPQVLTNGSGYPDNKLTTMIMHLYKTGFRYDRMGYAAAIAYVIFLILVIFSIFALRAMSEDKTEKKRIKKAKKLALKEAKA